MVKLGCFAIHSRSKLHSKLQEAAYYKEPKSTPAESFQVVEPDVHVVDFARKNKLVSMNVQEKDQLQHQLTQKIKELEELAIQKDELRTKVESLELALKSAKKQVVEVEKQLLGKDSQTQQFAQEKAFDLVRIGDLEKNLDDAKDHVIAGEKQRQQILLENHKLRLSLDQMKANERNWSIEVAKLEQQNAKLQKQILEAKSDNKQVVILKEKGINASKSGKYIDALDFFSGAIYFEEHGRKDKATLGSLYNLKGDCLAKLKKYQEAVSAYSSAISYQPNEASYYQSRGVVYYYQLKNYSLARKDFQTVLEIWPGFENAKTLLDAIKQK